MYPFVILNSNKVNIPLGSSVFFFFQLKIWVFSSSMVQFLLNLIEIGPGQGHCFRQHLILRMTVFEQGFFWWPGIWQEFSWRLGSIVMEYQVSGLQKQQICLYCLPLLPCLFCFHWARPKEKIHGPIRSHGGSRLGTVLADLAEDSAVLHL